MGKRLYKRFHDGLKMFEEEQQVAACQIMHLVSAVKAHVNPATVQQQTLPLSLADMFCPTITKTVV